MSNGVEVLDSAILEVPWVVGESEVTGSPRVVAEEEQRQLVEVEKLTGSEQMVRKILESSAIDPRRYVAGERAEAAFVADVMSYFLCEADSSRWDPRLQKWVQKKWHERLFRHRYEVVDGRLVDPVSQKWIGELSCKGRDDQPDWQRKLNDDMYASAMSLEQVVVAGNDGEVVWWVSPRIKGTEVSETRGEWGVIREEGMKKRVELFGYAADWEAEMSIEMAKRLGMEVADVRGVRRRFGRVGSMDELLEIIPQMTERVEYSQSAEFYEEERTMRGVLELVAPAAVETFKQAKSEREQLQHVAQALNVIEAGSARRVDQQVRTGCGIDAREGLNQLLGMETQWLSGLFGGMEVRIGEMEVPSVLEKMSKEAFAQLVISNWINKGVIGEKIDGQSRFRIHNGMPEILINKCPAGGCRKKLVRMTNECCSGCGAKMPRGAWLC